MIEKLQIKLFTVLAGIVAAIGIFVLQIPPPTIGQYVISVSSGICIFGMIILFGAGSKEKKQRGRR